MAVIRAVAIHMAPQRWSQLDIVSHMIELSTRVHDYLHEHRVDAWTLRIVMPPIPSDLDREWCRSFAKMLSKELSDVLVAAFPLEPESPCIDIVMELINDAPNVFGSVRCSDDLCLSRVVGKVLRKNVDVDAFTRFAIIIGTWIETPYFPASANVSMAPGLSASLRYVDLVEWAMIRGDPSRLFSFIASAMRSLEEVASCSGIPFKGFDLSLSPWMNESVGHLVERLINAKIGNPGTFNAVYSLNKLIKALSRKLEVKTLGFNEVMFPVAEDDVLNERVKEGYLRLRDLVALSTYCVAGLDMVAVPQRIDLLRLSIDLLTVHRVKRRPIAMRVIPVDAEPGSEVQLRRFGTTYVVAP